MKTVALKLPETLDKKLTAAAKQRGQTKAAVVREAIDSYLKEQPPDANGSFLDVAKEFVGCLEGPGDLSCNPEYMRDFGK